MTEGATLPPASKRHGRAYYRHFLTIPTRWMDNDSYGHVNNVTYYSYFDTVVNEHLIRVGQFDVHRLVAGRALVIGGETIPFDRGLAGHSDADVLLHAVLGALALGDIGGHFPDTSPQSGGASRRRRERLERATHGNTQSCRLLRRNLFERIAQRIPGAFHVVAPLQVHPQLDGRAEIAG